MLKTFLLIGASAAALAASSAEALTSLNYTGGFQTFTASVAGTYVIDAYGAQGGTTAGGHGAGVGGTFTLTAGEVLEIAVGGQARRVLRITAAAAAAASWHTAEPPC